MLPMKRTGAHLWAWFGVVGCSAGEVVGEDPTLRAGDASAGLDVLVDVPIEDALRWRPLRPDGSVVEGGADASIAVGDGTAAIDTGTMDAAADAVVDTDASAMDALPPADAGAEAAVDVEPEDVPLPPMVMPRFLVGYNEAWFGGNFSTGLTTNFDLAYVNRTFDGIVMAGGHVVRIFLFELNQGVTLNPTAPRTASLSPTMLSNLDTVLTAARRRGLWVYVTALEGNSLGAAAGPPREYYVDLLNDRNGEGVAFAANVLAPMLNVLDAHRDNVFGLDLMNEFEAPRSHGFWSDPIGGPRGWIQRTAAFVHAHSPWLRVTSSAGWDTGPNDIGLGLLSGLGLNFYDLHSYSDGGGYAGQTAICNRAVSEGMAVVLGEFGQQSHRVDDTLQAYATGVYLYNASTSCFSAALAWRFDAAENWWNFVRSDGSFRPGVSFVQAYGR